MQKIATDIYTFAELREKGFVYVDKTDILHAMASGNWAKQFFIARPRRFGKSLAVSTFQSLFEGRRDLFAGLAVDSLEWNWRPHPVLRLDMGSAQCATVAELHRKWRDMLHDEAKRNGVEVRDDVNPATVFKNVLVALAEKSPDGQAVLLIDEYDKPLLGHLSKPDVNAFRDAMKAFYSVIKTLESKQRFAFLTGVSKFSKASVFSDLNNLVDATMHPRTATLFGYTHDEVKRYFREGIHDLADKNGMTDDEAFDKIVAWYDGYRFEESGELVINPVSLGLCLNNLEFMNYWSQTAMPTFLIDTLKRTPLDFSTIDVTDDDLSAYEPENPDITTLLYQTGYLTIKNFQELGGSRYYQLGFPNREIEESFLRRLVPAYTGMETPAANSAQVNVARALYSNDVPKFVKALKAFFANIPYSLTDRQNEQMWQTIVYVVLKSIGVGVHGEVQTNDGRIDMTADTPAGIYLIEFKLDRTADEALAQIKENRYADRFALDPRPLTLIGVSFSSHKRTIVDVKTEIVRA